MTRLNRMLVLAAMAILSGCSAVPALKTANRGLLQETPEAVRPLLPVSTQGSVAMNNGAAHQADFIWPVSQGAVTSFFGKRKRDFHEGIDIRANRGTPVYAARGGEVIYSSRRIRGYGNMIVIKHEDGLATVYAHNKKNTVRKGDRVGQGQLIGYIGATGKATGPHLHFEIRKGELAQDPLVFLPQMRAPAMANH